MNQPLRDWLEGRAAALRGAERFCPELREHRAALRELVGYGFRRPPNIQDTRRACSMMGTGSEIDLGNPEHLKQLARVQRNHSNNVGRRGERSHPRRCPRRHRRPPFRPSH